MPSTEAIIEPGLNASIDQYLSYLEGFRRCARNTIAAYVHDLQGFLQFCNARNLCTPREITESVLESYLGGLRSLSPNTIRRRAHCLSGWLDYCCRQQLIPRN